MHAIRLCCAFTKTDFVLVSSCMNMHALGFLSIVWFIKQSTLRTRATCFYQPNTAQMGLRLRGKSRRRSKLAVAMREKRNADVVVLHEHFDDDCKGCNMTLGRAEIALNVGWIRALRKHVIVFSAAKQRPRNTTRRSRSPLSRLLEERLFFSCVGADGRRCDNGFEAAFPCAVKAVVCSKPSIFMLKAGRVGILMAPSSRCRAVSEAPIWSIMQIRSLTLMLGDPRRQDPWNHRGNFEFQFGLEITEGHESAQSRLHIYISGKSHIVTWCSRAYSNDLSLGRVTLAHYQD